MGHWPGGAASNIGWAAVFAAVFAICYVQFLNRYFDYAGFALYPRDLGLYVLTGVFAVAPSVAYRGHRALSSGIAVLIFVILYVPIILTFAFASTAAESRILAVQAVLAIGMSLIFLVDRLVIRNPLRLALAFDLYPMVLGATLCITLYMLIVYRGSLSLVGFEDVYDLRSANAELGAGVLTRYLSLWLLNVFIPLCLSFGLTARRPVYFVAGSAACLTIYMASAAKVAVLFPFVFAACYLLFANGRLGRIYPIVIMSLGALMLVMLSVGVPGSPAFMAASIVLYRTVGNAGLLTVVYDDFFAFHPQTNYAHINVLRTTTHAYPYGLEDVGAVVGRYYWTPDMNANANFFATDGIAAAGIGGIWIATLGILIVLAVMNSLTRPYERLFTFLCFLPFASALLNASLFTAVWSGGAVFLLVFFLLSARSIDALREEESPALCIRVS